MIPIKTEAAWRGTADCRNCGIRDMVLFADLNEQDFSLIHTPIDDLEYEAGTLLHTEGQPGAHIYTLRRGALKLVRYTVDGRARIVRVLRAGDVAGLEALVTGRYDSEAVTLTDAAVCRIPLSVIQTLQAQSPRLHKRLMEKWYRALREADDWLAELNYGSARQRVANFVLRMRSANDAQVATLYSREDMGAMLDLKLETVSREISALVKSGAVEPLDRQGRLYRILDANKLAA
jgi:CRP-like cAMP-binding protein